MDRAEAAGFGVAAGGHIALLAALSVGLASARVLPVRSDPIDVMFVEEVGLVSTAPTPSLPALAASPDALPAPAPPAPSPVPTPAPTPPAARSSAPPAPRQPPAPRKPSRKPLDVDIPGESGPAAPTDSPPAATAGPAVEASLVAEVRRQVKPHWQRAVPTGADAEALRTELSLTLARDGRVISIEIVGTSGVTASNRPQVALHQERAKRAVTLASPFNLPAQYFAAWKQLNVTLDLRLSQ